MKIALFLLAVLVLLWLLRGSVARRGSPPSGRPPGRPKTIVACAQCGVHLPRDEALPGRGGVFCGEPHRVAYEQTHAQDR
jgi:uncharacterized protein